ncbi:hypothetical protein ACFLU5_13360 [Bacteroidota bacterium]
MRYIILWWIFLIGYDSYTHPVSINWITGKIEDNKIFITYKFLAEDLIYFHQPIHDEYFNYDSELLRQLATKHVDIILQSFHIKDSKNNYLKPEVITLNDHSITNGVINVIDLMKYDLSCRIEYKLIESEWTELTFIQNLGNHEVGIPTVSFLTIFENGDILVEDQELSTGQPISLKKGDKILLHEPSKLTSSYFTVSNNGVRHELTIPARTFNGLLTHSRYTGTNFSEKVVGYFRIQNPVFYNEIKLSPAVSSITSLTNNNSGNGFIYIDIRYPTTDYPDKVTLTWNDYSWNFRWFDSEIISIDSLYRHTFSRFQSKIVIDTHKKISIIK